MGGLWDVRLVQADDLGAALETLALNGMAITGADLGGQPAREWRAGREGVLVLGSEAHGISEGARAHLDQRVSLHPNRPIEGRGVESLNVVVAGGILIERWLGSSA
jgi:tRNA G18 (ribose-2'-O)-methylase SpoU